MLHTSLNSIIEWIAHDLHVFINVAAFQTKILRRQHVHGGRWPTTRFQFHSTAGTERDSKKESPEVSQVMLKVSLAVNFRWCIEQVLVWRSR